ncbi:hypothetical protein ACS5PU_12955 [Pedobacter sp. GSP4]|uniref:hypothetical protein n=1 Tax=Pedobacter sp. GSP4 TaxID=3453716 RepID=UPI003EEA552D
MKLKIKELFIGLEFKIERDVDIQDDVLLKRIIWQLEHENYEVVKKSADSIFFEETHGQIVLNTHYWDRVNGGSLEIIRTGEKRKIRLLFSVSIFGIVFLTVFIVLIAVTGVYLFFAMILLFAILSIQSWIDKRNKMHELLDAITHKNQN